MILEEAVNVLKIEADGILRLIDRIDNNFIDMVELIYNSTGRIIVGGIGKSGIIGRKIVATLNSTGTRSLFLHPVEAMHGDLGMVSKDDIFLALSNSGETDELNILLSTIQKIGCKIIAFTGNKHSTLAKNSDIIIDVGVEKEACPMGLAPTSSTTALLAMGDALAVVLINKRGFKQSDFQRFHPGGTLGQRLSINVNDIMITDKSVPIVNENAPMQDAIKTIDDFRLGTTLVQGANKKLTGIITDGDIRRCVAKKKNILELTAADVMTRGPRTLQPDSPTYDALNMMERYQITALPITDASGQILGILHLHDILGKGAFKFNGK